MKSRILRAVLVAVMSGMVALAGLAPLGLPGGL